MRSGSALTHAALLLAGVAAALPFLLPTHALPIPSFVDEWLGTALLVAVALLLALDRTTRWTVPAFAPWLLALAVLFAAHASHLTYPQIPLAWAAYVMLVVLAGVTGRVLAADLGEERVVRVLSMALVVSVMLNGAVAILQVFGVPEGLRDIVATTSLSRAVGQVGQANILATYLMLGLASALWLRLAGAIGVTSLGAAIALVAYAGALTGSRMILVHAGWLVVATAMAVRGGVPRRALRLAFTAAVVVVGMQFLVGPLHDALGWPVPATGLDRAQAALGAQAGPLGLGGRLVAWEAALEITREAPWFGQGPGTLQAELFARGLPDALAREGEVWASAHNLVVDVAVAGGVIGALLLVAGLLAWWLPVLAGLLRRATSTLWWVTATAGLVMVHAMLEAPLSYAHILVVVGLVMGVAAPAWQWPRSGVVRTSAAIAALVIAEVAGWVLIEYLRLDRVRFSAQATFLGPDQRAADARELESLGDGPLGPVADLWRFVGTPWSEATAGDAIALGARAVEFRPAFRVVAKQAGLLALAGYETPAEALLDHLVATAPWERERIVLVLDALDPGGSEALARLRERTRAVQSMPGERP